MSKTKKLLGVAAVVAGLVGASTAAYAGNPWGGTHNGGAWGASNYGFTVYNKVSNDIWVTWYDGMYGQQQGYGCIGPGQSIMIGNTSSNPFANGVYLQVEYKKTNNTTCPSQNTADITGVGKWGAGNSQTVEPGGSSFATVTGTSSSDVHFTQ